MAVPERVVPSLVTLSWQSFWLGPWRRLRGFTGHDVVQFEFCAHASWMGRVPAAAKVVYSAHNVETDYLRSQPSRRVGRRAFIRQIERLERQAVRASDLILTCTEADAARLGELYRARAEAVVIPNGFEDALLGFDRVSSREVARSSLGIGPGDTAVLFVGGRAPHNREAARFLEQELLPKLGPRAHLLLVGNCGERLAKARRDRGRIHWLGFVEDMRPLFAAADVGVNPVAYGSGSNLKLLEYLAVGLPVVTTPVGMRGFDRLGDAVMVAELDDFAAAVTNRRPVPAGLRSKLEEFGWSQIGARLRATYERLVRR